MKTDSTTVLVPPHFLNVRYNGAHYPGSPNIKGLEGGANCQQFAYELLRYNGFSIPDLRSRELWEDTAHTCHVTELVWGDLLLWNKTSDPYGAHVGVYIGDGQAIHLAKDNGYQLIDRLENFLQHPAYRVFIGAKRAKRITQTPRPRLNLLVLRCRDIELTRLFYEGLNLHFISEQHGNGSRHYAAVMDNGLVLELYPAKGEPDNTRLGFHFGGKSQRVLQDPDGRYVEIGD